MRRVNGMLLVVIVALAVSAQAQLPMSAASTAPPPQLVEVGSHYTHLAGFPTDLPGCDPYSYYPDPTCTDTGPNYGTGTSSYAQQHFVPYIVSGNGFVTTITITNLASVSNAGQLLYWAQNGSTLSRTTFTLPAGATMRLQTPESGRFGASTVQWLTVSTNADVGINSFFELKDSSGNVTNTIGFNDPQEGQYFAVPVEFAPGIGGAVGHTVGLAVANDTNPTTQLTLTLYDSNGKSLAVAVRNLPAFAMFVADLSTVPEFSSVLPSSDFVGTLTVTSNNVVSSIALEDDLGPFYSTPGIPAGETQMVVPHILTGGGFVTRLTLMNMDVAANNFDVKIYDQSGKLLQEQKMAVPIGGVARIATPDSARFSPTQVSWAMITSSGQAYVNSFFELENSSGRVTNTIGFNSADAVTDFTVPVEFLPGSNGIVGKTVGIAIANPSTSTANVTLKLVDSNGALQATATVTLNGNTQQAIDLSTLSQFKAVLPNSDFVGVVTVNSSVPVSTIALGDDFGPFYSTPIMFGRAQ